MKRMQCECRYYESDHKPLMIRTKTRSQDNGRHYLHRGEPIKAKYSWKRVGTMCMKCRAIAVPLPEGEPVT